MLQEQNKYFEEGLNYLNKGDTVQASEKFYKCAEDAIKGLAEKYELQEYKEAKENGRWNVNLLFRVADRLMQITGEDIRHLWSIAWVMHVEGFHEKRLEKSTMEPWVEDIRKLLKIAYGKE